MKAGHWLVALIVVAALAWWTFGHPGFETQAQRQARYEAAQEEIAAAKPKLYRWHDAHGTLQLTDTPPKGRKYEVVDIEAYEDDNVFPISDPAAGTTANPR